MKGRKDDKGYCLQYTKIWNKLFFFPEKQNFPGTQSRDLFPVGSDKEGFI